MSSPSSTSIADEDSNSQPVPMDEEPPMTSNARDDDDSEASSDDSGVATEKSSLSIGT